jgi:hypothetical protein
MSVRAPESGKNPHALALGSPGDKAQVRDTTPKQRKAWARLGGIARARGHSKKQLSKWAKLGGRPPKGRQYLGPRQRASRLAHLCRFRSDPDCHHPRSLSRRAFRSGVSETAYAFDSTTIDLCLVPFPWGKFRRHKSAVKVSRPHGKESENNPAQWAGCTARKLSATGEVFFPSLPLWSLPEVTNDQSFRCTKRHKQFGDFLKTKIALSHPQW